MKNLSSNRRPISMLPKTNYNVPIPMMPSNLSISGLY